MRKQINGLSLLVSEDLQMDIFEGSLFLFCNKHKRILKIIYWDSNGFCLWLLCEASHNCHYAKLSVMRRRAGISAKTVQIPSLSGTSELRIILRSNHLRSIRDCRATKGVPRFGSSLASSA